MSTTLTRGATPNSVSRGTAVGLVVLAGILAGAVVTVRPLVALAVVVAAIWGLVLLRHWGTAGLLSLSLSVMVPRYIYPVGGVNVNLERVVLPLLLAVMLMVLAIRKPGMSIRFGWSHLGLAIFLLANAVASLLNAPSVSDSLRLTLLIAIASLPFWILPSICLEPKSMRMAFYIFLGLGALEAVLGLVTLALYQLRGIDLGIQIDWLTRSPTPFGSLWEGNIFGSFIAAALVSAIALLLTMRRSWKWTWLLSLIVALLALALVASLSRGAWLGAMAGALVVLVLAGGQRKGLVIAAACAIVLTIALVQTAFPGSPVWSAAQHRVGTLGNLSGLQTDPTTIERIYAYNLALRDWREHPLIGWGAGSLGQSFETRSQVTPAWVSNLELHALHDSGVVGLFGLLAAIAGTVVGLVSAVRRLPRGSTTERGILVGLLAACITLLVAFQATEGTWLAYSWYVFGLAWTAAAASGGMPAGAKVAGRAEPLQVVPSS